MALFNCTTDQVPMSSICVKFCGVMPLLELRILKINSFPLLSLSCFDIQCIELNFCIWLYFTVVRIKFEFRPCVSIFVGVMPLLVLRILEIRVHSFPSFSLLCFDILSWNYAYGFALLYYSWCVAFWEHPNFLCWNWLRVYYIIPFTYDFVLLYYRSRQKGGALTQAYDKSPYTNRIVKRAKWQHQQRHKKNSIKQQLRTDLGRSVGVTTATQLVWLTWFTGPPFECSNVVNSHKCL